MATRFHLIAALLLVGWTGSAQAALSISSAPTENMNCAAGVCTSTSKNAVLNTSDLAAMLSASDVTVKTGGGAVTIGVVAPLTWASPHALTLDASLSVHINQPLVVEGTSGLTIKTNDGSTGGLFSVFPGGSVTFWDEASNLVIDGNTYKLVGDVATLAHDIAAKPNGHYALARNYDAEPDGIYSNSPITTVFTGVFEGLGNTIQNLEIALPNENGTFYIGFFQQLGRGIVRDVGLENIQISVPSEGDGFIGYIGTLVGINSSDNKGSGTVFNSHATGQIITHANRGTVGGMVAWNPFGGVIDGSYSSCNITVFNEPNAHGVAGLVGENEGLISNSHASGSLTAFAAAGLVFDNTNAAHLPGSGEIDNSYFDGSMLIYANGVGAGLVVDNVGTIKGSHATNDIVTAGGGSISGAGLAYNNENGGGIIIRSYATGNIAPDGAGVDAGGLVYANTGKITDSFATGSVMGSDRAGGLTAFNGGNIQNSYATGSVSNAHNGQGGLVGNNAGGTVTTSYSIGAVTGGKRIRTGGLVGLGDESDVTASYWDVDTSGQRKSNGGIRISDPKLKSGLPDGFDPGVWGSDPNINHGYPYLLALPPPQ